MKLNRTTALSAAIVLGLTAGGSEAQPLDINKVSPALVEMDLSKAPTHEQLSAAGQLGGVLTPTRPVQDVAASDSELSEHFVSGDKAERTAFGVAIQNWNRHQYSLASEQFDSFKKLYPNSAWASEATLHMACNARFTGQYSEADQLFKEVIEQNSDSTYVGARLMSAKAKSRLAVLRLMENNPEEAKQLFSDVHQNAPDWRLRTYASTWIRKLSALEVDAGGLLDCGTRALAYLLEQDGLFEEAEKIMGYMPANDEGFSIAELVDLSTQHGYYAIAVKTNASDLASVTEPVILQISRENRGGKGHYWVLEKVESERYYIFDPQMNRRFEFDKKQLQSEWQGNAILLSRTNLAAVGAPISSKEADSIYGGCCGLQRPPGESGDPGRNPDDPNSDKGCSQGAPVWTVNMVNMNIYVKDTPLWYENTIGPDVNIELSYNTQGVLARNEPFGVKWMFNYGTYLVVDPGKAVTILSEDGREDVFVKDSKGEYKSDSYFRTRLTEENGRFILTYSDGSQKIYGAPDGTKALQSFLLESIDPYGKKLTFKYDSQARMTGIEDASGRTTNLIYNSHGLIEAVRDPFGREAKFDYDEERNLIALTDMQGYTSTLAYDEDRLISSISDAKGTTSFYIEAADGIHNGLNAYNAPGTAMWENYRITVTNPNGDKEEYYYDGYHETGWYVDADNYQPYTENLNNLSKSVAKTQYKYTTPNGRKGEIKRVIYPDKSYLKYEYYSNNKIKKITDHLGFSESYKWNDKGLLSKYTDKLGNETLYTYAANDVDLIQVQNGLGTINIGYNTAHQVTEYADIMGQTTLFQYDENGNLVRTTDAAGVETDFVRNTKGLISEIKISSQTIANFVHDEIGRVVKKQGLNQYATHYQYNQLDTLVKVTSPGGRSTERLFNTCPRLIEEETLPGGRTYDYKYDNAKRLTGITDPSGGSITLERSKVGLITEILDKNSNRTVFAYSASGNLKEKVYADGSKLLYDYDKGRITRFTDARGITKLYRYNNKGQLSQVTYSDGTAEVSYEYDIFGRLSAVTDGLGKTELGYYANGHLKFKDGPWANDRIELSYTGRDELRSLSVNGKLNTSYIYDDLGRLIQADALGQQFNYSYDDTSESASVISHYPNGITGTTQYNSKADLSELVYQKGNQTLASYHYSFDKAGQLSEQTGTQSWDTNIGSFTARYNNLNQITHWNGDESIFAYDKSGNLIKGLLPDNIPFTAAYDGESRLVKVDFIKNGISYSERFTYGYDHMLAVYQRYEDDKLVQEKRFVRLGLLELEQHNSNGEVEQQYAWRMDTPGGIGGLLTTKTRDGYYYYLYNHIGSVQKVVNQDGKEVENYLYTPYGISSGSKYSNQSFGYSTKRSDFESGLVYFGYRFYVPNLRRWLNRDPLQEQGGINLYAYVEGDPLGYVDPDGRIASIIARGVTGAISGGVGGAISGGVSGAVAGAVAGGVVGLVNPAASTAVGAAVGSATASAVGQAVGNILAGKDPLRRCNYNVPAVVGAGLAGVVAGPLNTTLSKLVPPIRRKIIGRPVSSSGINRTPGLITGATVEGSIVGSGELVGAKLQ